MSLPYSHPHPSPLRTLAPHLLPHIPYCLPLLRRLQYHDSSPTAHVLATFPPSISSPPQSFTAIYVDRARAPETECWIFSTHELPTAQSSIDDQNATRAQILVLLHAIAQLPSPSPLMVIGSLHEKLVILLGGDDLEAQEVLTRNIDDASPRNEGSKTNSVLYGKSVPYTKWLIAPPPKPSTPTPSTTTLLPPNYTFSKVQPDELPLIISRTTIPKTVATLKKLGSVAIRYTPLSPPQPETLIPPADADLGPAQHGDLIAWAFIGVDGSLSTLHVEPAHRKQGLAKAVCARLFAELAEDPAKMGFRAVEGRDTSKGWADSDVAVGNSGSARVAVKVGGREGWGVRWVGVDLRRVEGAIVYRKDWAVDMSPCGRWNRV